LLAGCGDPSVLRAVFEFVGWARSYYEQDNILLEDTFKAAMDMIKKTGIGEQKCLEPRRYRLPAKPGSNPETQVWASGGTWHGAEKAFPCYVPPLSQRNEETLIKTLATELRVKLALDVDPSPSFERGLGLQSSAKKSLDFMIVGSSNASRLRDALVDKGYVCSLVFLQNWCIQHGSIDSLVQLAKTVMAEAEPATVILQLLDSSIYYSREPDGSRSAPRRGEDGSWHVEGELTVCNREIQLEHYKAVQPLIELFAKEKCLLITPLPRYIIAGGCVNPDHSSNRRWQGFKDNIYASLELLRKNFKDFLFYEGRRNVKVLDPCVNIRNLDDTEVWKKEEDPVHPVMGIYKKIAETVVRMSDSLVYDPRGTKVKPKRMASPGQDRPASSGPGPSHDWQRPSRGPGRGFGEWRGRGGGYTEGRGYGGRGGGHRSRARY
jgi:hypothetical protein